MYDMSLPHVHPLSVLVFRQSRETRRERQTLKVVEQDAVLLGFQEALPPLTLEALTKSLFFLRAGSPATPQGLPLDGSSEIAVLADGNKNDKGRFVIRVTTGAPRGKTNPMVSKYNSSRMYLHTSSVS